jgi:Rieske Fe-S protein
MNRKDFIKTCGFACLGTSTLGILLQSCTGSKVVMGQINGDNIVVPLTQFEQVKGNVKSYRKFLVIQNDLLKYPIYVYRFSENEFTALYMQCTHQGNELTAYGDKLVCSAHGSEFDNKGNVTNSPAEKPLKSFLTLLDSQNLIISLKAV